jgi:hypothetical protein
MLTRSLRECYAVYLFLKCVLTLSHPFYFLVEKDNYSTGN